MASLTQAGLSQQPNLPVPKALFQLLLATRSGTRLYYLYPSTKTLLVSPRVCEIGHVYTAACRFSGMNLRRRVV